MFLDGVKRAKEFCTLRTRFVLDLMHSSHVTLQARFFTTPVTAFGTLDFSLFNLIHVFLIEMRFTFCLGVEILSARTEVAHDFNVLVFPKDVTLQGFVIRKH